MDGDHINRFSFLLAPDFWILFFIMFVDSHAHIDGEEYDADRDEVVERAREAGVCAILNVGTGDPHSGTLERAVEVAEKYEGVYAAVGVHPHDARLFNDDAAERILRLTKQSSRVIAWGEIGLDYHYDNSPRDVQRDVFRRQLRLAREANLPVIIHSREADDEIVNILREELKDSMRRGVMHCFGGSRAMLEGVVKLGFMISFAGNVTFKKAEDLREAARLVPRERLLIETDCPFLTPVPFRGRRNEPARVVEVAQCLADLHSVTKEEIGRLTTNNFARFFGLEISSGNKEIVSKSVEPV
jgi:TatD DNase family protein